MGASAYQILEVERIIDQDGKDLAVDINDCDCIVRVSRRGNVGSIARAMMALGIELGARGAILLPIVAAAGEALSDL